MRLPDGFDSGIEAIVAAGRSAVGHMKEREMRLLAMATAACDAEGTVLEIGSYKGKSTVLLARAARLGGRPGVVAVDPLTPDAVAATAAVTGADTAAVRAQFYANVERAGVSADVEFHEMRSTELARSWKRAIRLLWIDGDHSYAGARSDLSCFAPYLTDGAIVALHDVLSPFEGPVRVFADDVLGSSRFGACGFCGSIGWAQRTDDAERVQRFEPRRRDLRGKLERLVPYVAGGARPRGWRRTAYKLWRWRVPHAGVDADQWLRAIDGGASCASR